MSSTKRIGFIGLGAMGMEMASQVLSKGHTVAAHDIRPEARDAWEAKGGLWADCSGAAAEGADALALMVVSSRQVLDALFGERGAAGVLPRGAPVIVHSTVPASFIRLLGERLWALGHPLLDAPVSGGVAGASKGALTVMASGSPEAFLGAAPVLESVAARVFRVGDTPGMGSVVKTVNQLLAGSHIALAAEAMAFGTKAGVDPAVLYEVISNSAGNSWMFTNRVPHMLEGDFRPLSAVDIFVKDLGIVQESAREMDVPVPMASLAHQLFIKASAEGLGRQDDSAVVKLYESLAGVKVSREKKGSAG